MLNVDIAILGADTQRMDGAGVMDQALRKRDRLRFYCECCTNPTACAAGIFATQETQSRGKETQTH